MNSIWLLLGLKPEGFRAGLKRSTDDVKGFEKTWKDVGKLFGAGGLTAMMVGFFNTVIAHAREAKNETDANYEAVRRFGTALDASKDQAAGFGVMLLGWLNRIGEAWGGLISIATRGIAAFEVGEAAAAGAEAAEKSLAAAKKHEAEFKAITTGLKSEAQKVADLRAKGLSAQELVNARANEEAQIIKEIVNYEGDKLGARQLELKLAEARTKLQEAENALDKENADIARKNLENIVKQGEVHEKLLAENKKLQFEALTAEKQIETLAQSELTIQGNINALKAAGKETLQEEVELLGVTAELTALRADQAERVAAAEEKSRKAMEGHAEAARRTQQAYEAIMFGITNGGYDSRQIGDANDAALQEILRRNNGQLQGLRSNPGSAFSYGNSLTITRLENENNRIQRELDTRNDLRRDVGFLGVEGARRQSNLDPIVFDRLVQQFVTGLDKTDQTNRLLEDIVKQIGGGGKGNLPGAIDSLGNKLDRSLTLIGENLQRV